MDKEGQLAAKRIAAGQTDRALAKWCALLDRQYPDIQWQHEAVSEDGKAPSPTPIHRMQLLRRKFLFGLVSEETLKIILTQSREEMDVDTLLSTFALILQGGSYLRRQKSGKDAKTMIRGPKPESASMRALLKADIFATLLLYGAGDHDAVHRRAKRRAEGLLTARHGADPSLYALPMATDTIQVVLPTLARSTHTLDRLFFTEALARAEDICRCIDPSLLSHWYGFGQAAQDMAWRGASKRSILGSAFMADAPHIRTIAMMVSDLTGLTANSADQLTGAYSAFSDMDANARAHEHAMDQEFAWVLAQDPLKHGSHVFLAAADRQINNLQKGQVAGWCADALHESAKAFDDNGGTRDALAAAKSAFDEHKSRNAWDKLNSLGEAIVDRCRKGLIVGLRELYDLAGGEEGGLGGVRDALEVKMMLTNPTPNALHPAPMFSAPAAAPTPPAPRMDPVLAPAAPRVQMRVPTLGGPGMSGGSTYIPVPPPVEKDGETIH